MRGKPREITITVRVRDIDRLFEYLDNLEKSRRRDYKYGLTDYLLELSIDRIKAAMKEGVK